VKLFTMANWPGETKYIDEKGITRMQVTESDNPFADKEIRVVMPQHSNEVPRVYFYNLTQKEKEEAFEWLKVALFEDISAAP
jgi:hypothetical protein